MVSTRSVAGTGVRARRNRADDVAGLGRARAGVFVAPALLMIGMFLLFPAIWTIYLGMTDFRLTGLAAAHTSFVGLGNFTAAFGDKAFWNALQLTVVFVALSGVVGQSLLGFSLAWSLRRLKGWVRTLVESLALAAWVIPGSVNAFLWIALLDRRDGTLNTLLNTPGTAWLISYPMAMIVIFNIWVGTAFSMQLFSSALSSVSPSQLESAQIAGASEFRQLFDIVLPTIKGHILTNTLMITLWTFNTFTPFLLTAGGPNRKTEIFSVYIYKSAIGSGRLGFGAAISMIMLLINLAIALLYMRVGRKK